MTLSSSPDWGICPFCDLVSDGLGAVGSAEELTIDVKSFVALEVEFEAACVVLEEVNGDVVEENAVEEGAVKEGVVVDDGFAGAPKEKGVEFAVDDPNPANPENFGTGCAPACKPSYQRNVLTLLKRENARLVWLHLRGSVVVQHSRQHAVEDHAFYQVMGEPYFVVIGVVLHTVFHSVQRHQLSSTPVVVLRPRCPVERVNICSDLNNLQHLRCFRPQHRLVLADSLLLVSCLCLCLQIAGS